MQHCTSLGLRFIRKEPPLALDVNLSEWHKATLDDIADDVEAAPFEPQPGRAYTAIVSPGSPDPAGGTPPFQV